MIYFICHFLFCVRVYILYENIRNCQILMIKKEKLVIKNKTFINYILVSCIFCIQNNYLEILLKFMDVGR